MLFIPEIVFAALKLFPDFALAKSKLVTLETDKN